MTWVRLLGAVLLMGSGGMWGHLIARQLRRRTQQLGSFQRCLELVRSEIGFGLSSLPTAWNRAASQGSDGVATTFRHAALHLRQGTVASADLAWMTALQGNQSALALRHEDLEVLKALGPVLMLMSAQEQARHLELTCTRLRQLEAVAQEQATRYGQLSLQLGILGTLALTIVLW